MNPSQFIDGRDLRIAGLEAQNEALAARLVALEEAERWQPIETAPRDSLVLLWSKKWGQQLGCWGNFEKYNQPEYSHWMPMPPAPKEGE